MGQIYLPAAGLRWPSASSSSPYWRVLLFAVMFRNASSLSAFFKVPSNRVVELGPQVIL